MNNIPNDEIYENIIERSYNDPVLFNDVILNRPRYWSRQAEAALAVARHHDTVIDSGNSVGQDWMGSADGARTARA